MAQKLKTTVTVRDLMTQNPITLDRNETLDLVGIDYEPIAPTGQISPACLFDHFMTRRSCSF
jgi:hypothetical protein